MKKQVYLNKERKDFYANEDNMINLIDERYNRSTTKLYQSYDIALFVKPRDMESLQALVVILG